MKFFHVPKELNGLSDQVLSHWFSTGKSSLTSASRKTRQWKRRGRGGPTEHKYDLAQGVHTHIMGSMHLWEVKSKQILNIHFFPLFAPIARRVWNVQLEQYVLQIQIVSIPIFLIIFWAHMNILFITEVKIFLVVKWSYEFPPPLPQSYLGGSLPLIFCIHVRLGPIYWGVIYLAEKILRWWYSTYKSLKILYVMVFNM